MDLLNSACKLATMPKKYFIMNDFLETLRNVSNVFYIKFEEDSL